ncbi:MAG: hypothetical protein ABI599_08525 [Flavobacteriales bacterium]
MDFRRFIPSTARLKAITVFTPGIVLIVAFIAVFWNLEQGKDTIRQSLDGEWRRALHCLGLIYMGYVTWYGSRLVGFARWEVVGTVPLIRNFAPRFLGFSCYTAVLVAVAVSGGALSNASNLKGLALILVLSGVWFGILLRLGRKWEGRAWNKRSASLTYYGFHAGLLALVVVSGCCGNGHLTQAILIGLMQVLFTFLICLRTVLLQQMEPKPTPWLNDVPPPKKGWLERSFPRERGLKGRGHPELLPYDIEYKFYKFFVFGSMTVLGVYVLIAGLIKVSQFFGAFAVALLGGAVLVGIANMFSVIKTQRGVSLGLVAFGIMIFTGLFKDNHYVRTLHVAPNSGNASEEREALRQYLTAWLAEHVAPDTARMGRVPVYFVLADGGASRSGYWVAQVLGRIQDEKGAVFSDKLLCLSGASGGSVGIGTYHALLSLDGSRSRRTFRKDARAILGTDFLSPVLSTMLCTDIINLLYPLFNDRARTLEESMEKATAPYDSVFTHGMRRVAMESRGGALPILCLNTVRMQDGKPSYTGNVEMNEPAFSVRLDVYGLLNETSDLRLSSAMVLSSRFPYISPAGRIDHTEKIDTAAGKQKTVQASSYFVDGGYFDNSGAGLVDELILTMEDWMKDSTEAQFHPYAGRIAYRVIHISNTEPAVNVYTRKHPLLNDLAAPLLTVAGTYASQTDVNNARLLRRLKKLDDGKYCELNLYKHDSTAYDTVALSMNWVISDTALARMDSAATHHHSLDSLLLKM